MPLNKRSTDNLLGVHPDLVRVAHRAFEIEPFIITEGLRSLATQKKYVANGSSWTLNSRHLTGHAIDFADPDGQYDEPDMIRIGRAFKAAAAELGIPIVWGANVKQGGDWKTRWDIPHIELDRKAYPAASPVPVADRATQAVKTRTSAAVGGAAAGTAGAGAIPAPPDLTQYTAWQQAGETVSSLGNWAIAHPLITSGLVVWVLIVYYAPKLIKEAPA